MEADTDNRVVQRKTSTCANAYCISNIEFQCLDSMLVNDDFISCCRYTSTTAIVIGNPNLVNFPFIYAMPHRGNHADIRIGTEELAIRTEAWFTTI